MAVTKEQIEEALKGYVQPHMQKDLVSTKAIKGIDIDGGAVKIGEEVVQISVDNGKVGSITTASGNTYSAGMVLNCGGPWAKEIGKMAGVHLAVEPDRHEVIGLGAQVVGHSRSPGSRGLFHRTSQ